MDRQSIGDTTLFHGSGEVRLDFTGNPALIDIVYRGDASIHTNLGRRWILKTNKERILLVARTTVPLNNSQVLFKYRGEFLPVSCKVIGWELDMKTAKIVPEKVHYWDTIKTEWDELNISYIDLENTYRVGNPLGKKRSRNVIRSGGAGGY